jgi:hypothetical protein
MILGAGQLGDAYSIAPEHPGGDVSWIIAGSENDDSGARNLFRQTFEIAVCRDQDEVVVDGVLQNPAIARTRKPVSKRTF